MRIGALGATLQAPGEEDKGQHTYPPELLQ
jgi:hypothetical protein